ncbi:hypothetical protein FQA39_LY08030 [Lamprigera yunnana]|nr:hypothetical protein FQA39_LY08030 [Lamprigera yunnana]
MKVVVLRAKDAAIKDATYLRMKTTDDLRCKLPAVPISSEEKYCKETLDEETEMNVQNSTVNNEFFENNDIGRFTREDLTLLQSCGRNIHKEKIDLPERPFVEKEKIQIDEWVVFSKGKGKTKEFLKETVPAKLLTKTARVFFNWSDIASDGKVNAAVMFDDLHESELSDRAIPSTSQLEDNDYNDSSEDECDDLLLEVEDTTANPKILDEESEDKISL